jgi:Flp pilus assembly protein CpaB
VKRLLEPLLAMVAIAAAIGITLYVQSTWTKNIEQHLLPVPLADIPPYTILNDSLFTMKEFPRALDTGYAASLSDLHGKISTSLIPSGLPVAMRVIRSIEEFRLAPPSMRVLSIPISPETAVGGEIRIGEKVDIFRITPAHDKRQDDGSVSSIPTAVDLVAKNVLVVDIVGDTASRSQASGIASASESTSSRITARILVLALTPEDANRVLTLMGDLKGSSIMWITLSVLDS